MMQVILYGGNPRAGRVRNRICYPATYVIWYTALTAYMISHRPAIMTSG